MHWLFDLYRTSQTAPAIATVYPLTTLLRILAAQVLTVTLCG